MDEADHMAEMAHAEWAAERDAEKLRDEINTLRARCEAAEQQSSVVEAALFKATETWTDDIGNAWNVPTAWAYMQSCKVREELRAAAERRLALLRECIANRDELAYETDLFKRVEAELTASGAQGDGK